MNLNHVADSLVAMPPLEDPDFIVVISGAPQDFRGLCVLLDWRGTRTRIKIAGVKPITYALEAKGVDCRIDRVDQHAGALWVELHTKEKGNLAAKNSTNSAFGCIHVRSDGPWGKAYRRRCMRTTPFGVNRFSSELQQLLYVKGLKTVALRLDSREQAMHCVRHLGNQMPRLDRCVAAPSIGRHSAARMLCASGRL